MKPITILLISLLLLSTQVKTDCVAAALLELRQGVPPMKPNLASSGNPNPAIPSQNNQPRPLANGIVNAAGQSQGAGSAASATNTYTAPLNAAGNAGTGPNGAPRPPTAAGNSTAPAGNSTNPPRPPLSGNFTAPAAGASGTGGAPGGAGSTPPPMGAGGVN